MVNLPMWLEWLGSSVVCTIVSAVAAGTTIWSLILKRDNRNLNVQSQQQQEQIQQQQQQIQQLQQIQQQGGHGAQQQQHAIQQVAGNVTINNNYYNTEGEN